MPFVANLDSALDPPAQPVRRGRVLAASFVILTALTLALTYPQALQLRTGIADVGDPLLNAWTLAWVAHQAPIAPARVFDANIFYPERWTLAYSEPMLVPGLMAAPLSWLGAGPILVYNVVFLSALVLSGLGTTLLVLELTGQPAAAVIAGIIFAFLPFRFDHYSHLQLQQTQWIPLAMWALHRVARVGRPADGARLGLFAACQMLSCVYFGVFLVPYAVAAGVVLLLDRLRLSTNETDVMVVVDREFARRTAVAIGAAAVVYTVLVAPVGRAHLKASQVVGERSAGEAIAGSATPGDFLGTAPSNRLYGGWADVFGHPERRLFPGAIAVILALVGMWRPWPASKTAYIVALLLALDLSLGFNGISYRVLWNAVLPFRGLRVPARMGLFVGFSVAVLAGYGVARLAGAVRSRGARGAMVVVLGALIAFEYRSVPVGLTTMPERAPQVYDDLVREIGDAPRAAIVELPLGQGPTYMYYSTFHWQVLLNGYSGFFPPSYYQLADAMATFPDPGSLQALRRRETRFVLIHGELMPPEEYDGLIKAASADPSLKLISRRPWRGREISLYRLLPDELSALRPAPAVPGIHLAMH